MPIFAEILGTIDKNYNLSLIHDAPDQSSLIAKLWLGIFANKQICTFSYNDVVLKNQQQQQHNYRIRVPGIGALLALPDYRCKFPFSWIVKDTIDSRWDSATALVGKPDLHGYAYVQQHFYIIKYLVVSPVEPDSFPLIILSSILSLFSTDIFLILVLLVAYM